MRLLKKSTVQLEAQSQRKSSIEEGMIIARKVDALRQTLGELQQQHQKFLDGMQGELESRTKPLIDKIAYLQSDIESLEEKRKLLRVPLDKEWEQVHVKQAALESSETTLEGKRQKLVLKEEKLISLGKDLKDRIFKIKTQERELSKALKNASESLYIADQSKSEAITIKGKANEYDKEVRQNLLTLEAELSVREREVDILKKHTDDREKDLVQRERSLVDRYAALERTIKRITP